jgi:hypothetical protein
MSGVATAAAWREHDRALSHKPQTERTCGLLLSLAAQ